MRGRGDFKNDTGTWLQGEVVMGEVIDELPGTLWDRSPRITPRKKPYDISSETRTNSTGHIIPRPELPNYLLFEGAPLQPPFCLAPQAPPFALSILNFAPFFDVFQNRPPNPYGPNLMVKYLIQLTLKTSRVLIPHYGKQCLAGNI